MREAGGARERSDAELADAARGGDANAFGTLVRRHEAGVRALAASLLADDAEAEDAAQDAFVRALRNLDLLADPAKFAPWLRRIAFGVAVDRLRAFRPELFRANHPGAEAAAAAAPGAGPTPLERLEGRELAERVRAAVAALPPRYRAPLTLYHLDGLSHKRVARALGVPAGTVRSLVTRARQRLAGLLEDYAREAMSVREPVDEVFRERDERRRLLHILNGDALRWGLERSGVRGTFAVWADVLHEGPVPADVAGAAFRELRARYHARAGYVTYEEGLAMHERWDRSLDSFREYDEVVLWFEHDLFDQLLLIRHLDCYAQREMGGTRLSLICIGEYPGVPDFIGLGQLSPDQLASLLDTRQTVTHRQTELARQAWRAFTGPGPTRIERVLEGDTSALPPRPRRFSSRSISSNHRRATSASNRLSLTDFAFLRCSPLHAGANPTAEATQLCFGESRERAFHAQEAVSTRST